MPKNLIKSFILIAFGCVIGVFLSQFSYFTLTKEISLSDIFITLFTGFLALYIADDIAAKLSRSQGIKSLYIEELKGFIKSLQTLEDWIEEGDCSAKELRGFLKTGTIKLNTLIRIYGKHQGLKTNALEKILVLFNNLKNVITLIPISVNGNEYKFNPAQQHQFSEQLSEIKVGLVDAMVNA